jgi:pimeloyl-ACP methyl ester carboxylesterase
VVQLRQPIRFLRSLTGTALLCAGLLGVLATSVHAQRAGAGSGRSAQDAPRLDAVDHAQRQLNRARVGSIGPVLPPVLPDSPRDDLMYADRFPWGMESSTSAEASLVTHVIPAGAGGTETPIAEIIEYQLPDLYDEFGTPHPLVIAYHGYGASAQSVSSKTTLDEECNTRNWLYLSPTGMDDQLFGSGPSQQNTRVAIQYMLDNFNVDPDRLYMVGFSMGAGVTANFAAQQRDPDGIMLAAIGLVSGTFDWTMAYNLANPPLQEFMEEPLHFGGSTTTVPFEYQRYSSLYFDPATYLPIPGTLITNLSMAVNLGSTPVYATWDTTDNLLQVKKQNPRLINVLEAIGTDLTWFTVSSTWDPDTGQFAPHSWLVLDEVDLFDFFDGKVVDRTPDSFRALVDEDDVVSWLDLTQRLADQFSDVKVEANPGVAESTNPELSLTDADNLTIVAGDVSETAIVGTDPIDFTVSTIDGFKLVLSGAECTPHYLIDNLLGTLVPGVDHDPVAEEFTVEVGISTTIRADAICETAWTTDLWVTPKQVPIGSTIDLSIDAPPGTTTAWTLIGFGQALGLVKGFTFTVDPVGSFLVELPLDVNGDLFVQGNIPNMQLLVGSDIMLQVIGVDGVGTVTTMSNMWIMPLVD